jgi:transposase
MFFGAETSTMRGRRDNQPRFFFSIDVEQRIRSDHPLRPIKLTVDRILGRMDERFAAAYSAGGRPSVPPERLLKALLLMALYSVRSERQLVERIDTDLLFRWFLDMDPAEPTFDATVLTHNRARLDEHGLTAAFFDAVIAEAIEAGLCSHEHLSVDGTLIESYASIKSFRPVERAADAPGGGDSNAFRPRNAEVDFRGQRRSNATHRSTTDPEARLYRKSSGQEARLAHLGHALTENRHGLIMAVAVSEASGTAEVDAALALVDDLKARRGLTPKTLGTDRGYDSGPFYLELESRGIEPHGAMLATSRDMSQVRPGQRARVEARDRMRARLGTEGYRLSQKCRKKVEECFGWLKTIAGLGRSRWANRWKLRQQMELSAAAFNLVRLGNLMPR